MRASWPKTFPLPFSTQIAFMRPMEPITKNKGSFATRVSSKKKVLSATSSHQNWFISSPQIHDFYVCYKEVSAAHSLWVPVFYFVLIHPIQGLALSSLTSTQFPPGIYVRDLMNERTQIGQIVLPGLDIHKKLGNGLCNCP